MKNMNMPFATAHHLFLEHQSLAHQEYLKMQQRLCKKSLALLTKGNYKSPAKPKPMSNELKNQKFTHQYFFDPAIEQWINDHCPTFTRPALPMMSIIDIMASQANNYFPQKKLIEIKEVRVFQWAILDEPKMISIQIQIIDATQANVTIFLKQNSKEIRIAHGKLIYADSYTTPPSAPTSVQNEINEINNPYRYLFHGPTFQVVQSLHFGREGSTMMLNIPTRGPIGTLNHIVLDGATQGVYHEEGLSFWNKDLPDNHVCYPALLRHVHLYEPTPTQGMLRCETRFMGFHFKKSFPIFRMYLIKEERIWCEFELLYAVLPMGFMGMANEKNKKNFTDFIKHKCYTPDVHLSELSQDKATLALETMQNARNTQWFPHLIEDIYQVQDQLDLESLSQQILIKDYFANQLRVHPSAITIIDAHTVTYKNGADNFYRYVIHRDEERFIVERR